MKPEEKDNRRKKWEKPEVRVIELNAEEVMANGCKSYSGGWARNSTNCGLGVPCSVNGS